MRRHFCFITTNATFSSNYVKEQIDYLKGNVLLLIKRARIVAAAQDKISNLAKLMQEYKNDRHILVYCGAATMHDVDYQDGLVSAEEMRQVDVVADLLGNRLRKRISKFTSEEIVEERERLKAEFAAGQHLQALVAIRCLDKSPISKMKSTGFPTMTCW